MYLISPVVGGEPVPGRCCICIEDRLAMPSTIRIKSIAWRLNCNDIVDGKVCDHVDGGGGCDDGDSN